MGEFVLQGLTPADLSQKWTDHPVGNLTPYSIINGDRRSILGEILAEAINPNEWLSRLTRDDAVAAVSRVLNIPTLHVFLIDEVVSHYLTLALGREAVDINKVARNVLTRPEMFLGPNTPLILAFGRQIDAHTPNQWKEIHTQAPVTFWDFEEERKQANEGYSKPDYDFGYYVGQNVAELALIRAGVVSRTPFKVTFEHSGFVASYEHTGPPKTSLRNVDEMLGLAINEIQTFGARKGRQRLYFLPKFYDDAGRPLALIWLGAHQDPSP